ncbi:MULTISPECIES: glycosyltransferase family 2 protein [unclassified Streptomyces]|uniref:glycosyltransferase family 2 protein n=1 Tax=unclassified Streptomyces TaxID=2593676 RepID=UPI002E2A2076|nr:glycosyltransferase family A protein [Streptomyces sp. NBC_00223]
MLKASIVVPIYNAGEYIDDCAPSLTGQSLGTDDYEVIYVDDGSTDDSLERLRRLAELHPHVQVHTQENSGWPGKPRNVGVRLARSEYVHFVDQDDEIAPDALERLYDLAVRNDSDIVFGKTYGEMRGPADIFRHHRERCSVEDTDLFETLTPHKMFRRQFLLDNDILFPEGRVRLEDQLFLAHAYPLAKTVSILGEHPSYHWHKRTDGNNNSSTPPRPEDYYGHLRNVVRAIKEHSEPGPVQDRMLRRNYRTEILRPVTEPRVLQRTGEELERYFTIVRDLVREEFPPGVSAGFPAIASLRGHLLETGRLDSLVELARRTRGIALRYEVGTTGWRGGRLTIPVRAWLVRADGQPVTLLRSGDRLLLDPVLLDGVPGVDEWEVKDPFSQVHGEVVVKDTTRSTWWYAENDMVPRLEPLEGDLCHVVLSADAVIDPLKLAGGAPMTPGRHEVWLDTQLLGLGRRPRLTLPKKATKAQLRDARQGSRQAVVGTPPRVVGTGWTGQNQQLELQVSPPRQMPAARALLLRLSTDDRLRTPANAVGRRLPKGLRKRLRRVLKSAGR